MKCEILFRGKAANRNPNWSYRTKYKNGDWVFGMLTDPMNYAGFAEMTNTNGVSGIEVDKNTVGQFSGVLDTELKPIYQGDIVKFLRYVCTVVFEEGCFGLALNINDAFDWDYIDEEMTEYAGTNQITACFNDHFISLWEILWNFNCNQNTCNVVEVIGNIHDNPELLEGGVE